MPDPWTEPESGWRRRRVGDDWLGFEVAELGSNADPLVVLLAGVHGDEPTGVRAARQVMAETSVLRRGTLRVISICNEAAVLARTRRSPLDDDDLARLFPGDPSAATPSRRLAALICDQLSSADLLIDLHSASPPHSMALLAGCVADGSEAAATAREAARLFGPDFIWLHPRLSPGRTITVAQAMAIPAIYLEAPGGVSADPAHARRYAAGVRNVLRWMGLLDEPVQTSRTSPTVLRSEGDLDSGQMVAELDGFFTPGVEVGAAVSAGQRLGELLAIPSARSTSIRANRDGTIVLIAQHTALRAGETIAFIAPRPSADTPCG